MDQNIDSIIVDLKQLPNNLNSDLPFFRLLEQNFEANYDKLTTALPNPEILNSLGLFATIKLFQGLRAKDDQKVSFLKEFRTYLNKSDKIEINQKRSFALKGLYYFYQGDFKQSLKYFDNARDIDSGYLLHMLGRGLVEYQRKEYKAALQNFKQVFQLYRHIVPKAAYAMGLCYFNLNRLDMAEKCFSYMIKNNLGSHSENHIAVAIVKYKLGNPDGYYAHIMEAFDGGEGLKDLNTCLNLAEHYFFKKDFEKASKLAKIGVKLTDDILGEYKGFDKSGRNDYHELKSIFSYILGFVEHSAKHNDGLTEAYKYYKSALQSNPLNYAAQFGLAQILYYQRNYVEANDCLETILSKLPEHMCRDCYTLIPHVYMRLNKEQQAFEAFEKVMKYFPNNPGVFIDYVSYLEVSNPKKALEIYEKILSCSDKEKIEPEILNNMAVAFIQNKNYSKALIIIEKAKKDLVENNYDQSKTKALSLIIDYNTARIYQKQNLDFQALHLYQDLTARNPLFYECYLHMASIYAKRSEQTMFNETLNTALYICYKTLSSSKIEYPFYLQIVELIKLQSFNEALDHMSKIKRQDTFLLLYRSSILYNLVAYNRGNLNEAKKHIKHTAELCSMILRNKEETNNIYAANIVASLLAERGRANDALKIFRSFQDILDNNSPLWYNLAVAEYVAGNFEKAIIILESPKSYYKLRYDVLYCLLNVLIEKYAHAEKVLKYRYLKEPGLFSLYNFVSCLHKKVKDLFIKKEAKIDNVDLLRDSLKLCERVFEFVNASISPKVTAVLNAAIDKTEIERRRFFDLKKNCEKQMFYLQQNQESYLKMMEKELEKRNQLKVSQEHRKQVLEMEKNQLTKKIEETEKIQMTKEEMMELRAKEAMKMANSLLEEIKVQQMEIKQPAKKFKKEKVKSEQDEDEIPRSKDNAVKKVGKKIKKQKTKIQHEESEEDSFIAADLMESEESLNDKVYGESENEEESADEALYDPLNGYRDQNKQIKVQKTEPEPRRLTRKIRPVVKHDKSESDAVSEGSDNQMESPSVSESLEKPSKGNQKNIKDVNEDIYIAKHRPNKKLLMDEEEEE